MKSSRMVNPRDSWLLSSAAVKGPSPADPHTVGCSRAMKSAGSASRVGNRSSAVSVVIVMVVVLVSRSTRSSVGFGHQRVHAVLVMHLAAGDGRVENAHRAHLRAWAHLVLVVVVEQVEGAGRQLMGLPGGEIGDLSLSLDDEHGLDVVRVPEAVHRARVQRGVVHREADLLLREDD